MTRRAPKPISESAPREAWTVAEVLARYPTSRSSLYRAIEAGVIKSTRKLGARLIEAESVRKLFSESGA